MPTIHFQAACSTGDITLYEWDFGDGDFGSGADVYHLYTLGTSWNVTLTVSGPGGTSVTTATATEGGSGDSSASVVSSNVDQGTDPQVMLRMSNDGGKTWPVPERWRGAGKIGEYWKRIRWSRLGSARRRVFEVTVTDPVPWRLVGAELDVDQGQGTGKK